MGCCSTQPKKAQHHFDYSLCLSAQQHKHLNELFSRYATNEILNFSQFTQVFLKTQDFPEEVKQSAYQAFCSPDVKQVNLHSFLQTLCKALRSNRKFSLEFLFKVFDINNDGELSKEEFDLFVKCLIDEPYLEIDSGPKRLTQFTREIGKLKHFDKLLAPFAVLPTIEGEREAFTLYQNTLKSIDEGSERWLISSHWLSAWKAFTTKQREKAPKRPHPPGDIDNSYLHSPNTSVLKLELEEHKDYELLTKKTWTELFKQYGGGPEICRKYIKVGQQLELELHPPMMVFYRPYPGLDNADPSTRRKMTFTRMNTIEEVLVKYRTDIGLQGQVVLKRSTDNKVWEVLTDLQMTLDELKPKIDDSYLVISQQRDPNKKISLQSPGFNGSTFSTNGFSYSTSKSISPRTQVTGFKKLPHGPGLVGLKNLGQTCYISCVVQCLAHILPIREVLLDNELNIRQIKSRSSKITMTLALLFGELWKGSKPHVNPINFVKAFNSSYPRFNGDEQHDSHDFLATLLDILNEDLKPHEESSKPRAELTNADNDQVNELGSDYWRFMKSNGSTISNVCSGLTKISLICKNCSQVKVRFEDTLYLSVACEAADASSMTLNECLRSHFSEDRFQANCEHCASDELHSIRIRLYNAPQVLIICLKRFTAKAGRISKVTKAIEFPSEGLDLSKLVVGRVPSVYDLTAVVNHFGDIHHGHYTAVCKGDTQWVYFDDDAVSISSDDTSQWAQSGYILFYQLRS